MTLLLALGLGVGLLPARAEAARNNDLRSTSVLVVDAVTGEPVISKNPDVVMPIASLTKLMTALVVVEAKLPLNEALQIGPDDVDRRLNTTSRLPVGTQLSRGEMLLLALMASENRAANALSRHYPGGRPAFLARMNAKARELGMKATHFDDPAGLSNESVSTARDLTRLIAAAHSHELIRRDSTAREITVRVRGRPTKFVSTNRLVRGSNDWDIALQKTGFTNQAGRCLVMRATTAERELTMVFLNSVGTLTRFADAGRVRQMLLQKKRPDVRATKRRTLQASTAEATS